MPDFFFHLFDTSGFPPRWQCGAWSDAQGWLHILSDLGIWAAYFAIPCILVYFVLRRRDVPFRGIFWLFGAFILACGTTHLMEAIIFWHPVYRLAGVIKLLTAVVSWATVVALVPIIPKALAMRSPEELEKEIAARKKAEQDLHQANAELERQVEALRSSEERFRLLVDGTQDHAILMLDPAGRVASWNPGAERIKQYRASEILGQHFSRFYPAEDIHAGKPEQELRVAVAEGKYEEEGVRVRKDGTQFWANVVITPLRDNAGNLRGFSKVTRDMSVKKEAEEKARRLLQEEAARQAAEANAQVIERQREQLRVTLTSIGDGVVTTDAEGRVTFLNPVAESLTGWTTEDAAGQPLDAVFRIINETTRQTVENPVAKVLATGHIVGLANHTLLVARDGTERAIDDSAAPIKEADGRIVGVVLVFRDVTEQRRAERSARLLASIVESSDDAIISKDTSGIITSWNRAAERIFGYSKAEAMGQPVAILAPPNRPDEMPGILNRIKAGEQVDHFDTLRRAKDGRLVPISLTVSPIKDQEGHIVGASKIARDVSERKRAEAAILEEKARLHATLTGIGDGVIVTDFEGRVTLLNPVAQTLTGWQEEATGQPIEEIFRIVNEQTRQPVPSPVKRVLREGTVAGLENHTLLIGKDGTERPVDDTAAPVLDQAGRVAGTVLVFRDVTQRRRSEREQRDAENRLRSVVDHVVDGIIAIDERGAITAFNPAAQKIFGFTTHEVMGQNVKVLMPDPYHGEHDDYLANYLRTGAAKIIGKGREVVGRNKNGSTFPMDLAVSEFWLDDTRYFTGIVRDITERKKAEESLRQQAELLDLAHDAILVRSIEGIITFWNRGAEEMYGWRKEEAIGKLKHDLLQPQFPNPLSEIEASLDREGQWEGVLEHTRQDGTRIVVASRWALRRAEAGKAGIVLEINRDITERQRAEEEARKNQEIFQLVHQIGKIGHWEWNSLTDENKWSPEIQRLYGLQPGTFEGTYDAWAKLVHPDDLPKAAEDVRRALESGVFFTEFRVVWPDGTVRWIEARAKVFKDGHDKPVRIMGVNMDITERKQAEEALKEADRRKNEFLAVLSHELRNPLAPIRNALELLGRAEGDAAISGQARTMMERQVQQMVRLVDDLLDISRITSGRLQLRKERAELAAVVQSAVEASRPLIEAQSHELSVALPQEPVCLDADPTRLSQVVSNLLNNAAKYTEKGGHIWLTTERQGSQVVVSVRDTGIGIPAEHLPHLFKMFSQVAPALERSQGGLGIGLALVQGLVELHDGTIEAHSSPGKGSEFVVRLPAAERPLPAPPERTEEGQSTGGGPKLRILVADDNRDAADSLALVLRIIGHETQTAHDGVEAVQAAAAFQPDVALLDIGMPKMNGYEVAQHIRQQAWGKRIVLVASTGWGQEEDKRRATEAGFHYHLTKPVEPAALEKLLEGLTGTRS